MHKCPIYWICAVTPLQWVQEESWDHIAFLSCGYLEPNKFVEKLLKYTYISAGNEQEIVRLSEKNVNGKCNKAIEQLFEIKCLQCSVNTH